MQIKSSFRLHNSYIYCNAMRIYNQTDKCLIAILFTALVLRLTAISFEMPYIYLNTDEDKVIVNALRMGADGSLNPKMFLYPSLYLYVALSEFLAYYFLGTITGTFHSAQDFAYSYFRDPTIFFVMVRVTSALLGTATVYVTFRLGKLILNRQVALVSACILSFCWLHVFYSHQAIVDVPATFFTSLAILFSLMFYRSPNLRYATLTGIMIGLATGTKYPAGAVVVSGFSACLLTSLPTAKRLQWIIYISILSLLTFVMTTPYCIIDFPTFLIFIKVIIFLHGGTDILMTHFLKTHGLSYYLFITIPNAIGWIPLLISFIGYLYLLTKHTHTAIITGSHVFLLMTVMGSSTLFYDRFILPIMPLIALFCGVGVVFIISQLLRIIHKTYIVLAIIIVFIPIVLTTLVGDIQLSQTDTRVIVKQWIEENIPTGAKIFSEAHGPQLHLNHEAAKAYLAVANESSGERGQGRTYKYILDHPEHPQSYYLLSRGSRDTPAPLDYYVNDGYRYFILVSTVFVPFMNDPFISPPHTLFYDSIKKRCRLIKEVDKQTFDKSQNAEDINNLLIRLFGRYGPRILVYELNTPS